MADRVAARLVEGVVEDATVKAERQGPVTVKINWAGSVSTRRRRLRAPRHGPRARP